MAIVFWCLFAPDHAKGQDASNAADAASTTEASSPADTEGSVKKDDAVAPESSAATNEARASDSSTSETSASDAAASETATEASNEPPADPAALPSNAKLSYQPHIQRIFHDHCIECHGPKQAKAELRVDERDTLMSYIVPGDLESSSLWADYLTTTDSETRMPPVKYGKPLSELELAAIRVWIEDGAEWPDDVQPLTEPNAHVQAVEKEDPKEKGTVQKMWTFVGFFHPAVVHFPIGLLLISSLFVALAFIKREAFEPAAFHCLWIGTAAAVVACIAGWAFADIRGYGDYWNTYWATDLIARHRISGVGVTAFAVVLSLIAFVARKRTSSDLRILWLMGALCLAGMVSLVGHQGGELTYGEELFSRAYQQAFGITPVPPTTELIKP